jgi:predicted  nucleic acid-binding Zn-ribbon protein
MPHQCTDCGTVFADGSTEMLSGCPECDGNTFQFLPEGAEADPPTEPERETEPPDRPETGSVARSVGSAAATVRNLVGGSSDESEAGTDPERADPLSPTSDQPAAIEQSESNVGSPPQQSESNATSRTSPASNAKRSTGSAEEDSAQASARSAVVAPEELPSSSNSNADDGAPSPSSVQSAEPTEGDERPDLETLRAELNDQFESIRIVEPGQYELNLMELYERDEYIIALQEDGRYRIQVPDSW